jgi:hypothetical protein
MFGMKKEPEFKFSLGDEVKDVITGFTGICIGRHQWINNCNTYSVKSQTLKDGMPQEGIAFDEPQLEVVQEKVFQENRRTGGPERKVKQPNRF